MKKIKLTSGKFALVDDDMFEELNKFSWCLNGGYAIRGYSKNGKQAKLKMHRVIMNTPKGMDTDHIDNNKLNNQRNNLRVCTRSQNCMNRKKRSTPNLSSSFKGRLVFQVCLIRNIPGRLGISALVWRSI